VGKGARTPYADRVDGRGVPVELCFLFWEVDPATVDLERNRDYVIERVMSRGDWAAMRWLRTTYPREVLADFLRRRGARLAARERAYWALWAGLALPQQPGGGRPAWAAPSRAP
jgi:hypothetical protein